MLMILKRNIYIGNISILDPNYEKNESIYNINSEMNVRIRGASSRIYNKKSYRVCLYDGNKKKDLSLLGFRTDSDWILESLYTDDSKIRNLLSYDLWNLMNADIKDEDYAILKGTFVEVFMDEEYVGLYVLKEPIDEKTLNLKKNSNLDSGILLKGIDHNMADFSEEKIGNIKESEYYGFELKYPDNLVDYSHYWYVILSKIKNYYLGDLSDEVIENTFYTNNLLNFRLLVLFTNAVDNYEPKNVYFSLKDQGNNTKVILTPWDMDWTFGIDWDENISGPKEQYEKVTQVNGSYISTNSPNFVYNIKKRWNYLKQEVFNEKKINNLIDNYYEQLTLSGAIEREYEKWGSHDISVELQEIKDWCKKRFVAVDEYIDNL